MKTTMLVCAIVCFYYAHAKNASHEIYIDPSIGFFRLTDYKANSNNTPLMIDGKIGIRVGKKESVGLQFSSVSQSAPTSGISSLQPGGGIVKIFYERFIVPGKPIDSFPVPMFDISITQTKEADIWLRVPIH